MRKLVRKGSETGGWCFFKNEIWGSVLLPDIESGVPPGAPATEQERVPPYWVLTVQRVRQSVAHIHSLQLKGAMRAVRWLSVSSGPQRELGDWRDPQDQHCMRLGGQVSPASPLTSEMRLQHAWASLVAQMVKNPPDNADVRDTGLIPGICWRRELAAHSRILAWRIPGTEEPGGLQSTRSQRVGHD